MDIQEKEETTNNIPIVCEFEDVFPKDLLGLGTQRKLILRLN